MAYKEIAKAETEHGTISIIGMFVPNEDEGLIRIEVSIDFGTSTKRKFLRLTDETLQEAISFLTTGELQ